MYLSFYVYTVVTATQFPHPICYLFRSKISDSTVKLTFTVFHSFIILFTAHHSHLTPPPLFTVICSDVGDQYGKFSLFFARCVSVTIDICLFFYHNFFSFDFPCFINCNWSYSLWPGQEDSVVLILVIKWVRVFILIKTFSLVVPLCARRRPSVYDERCICTD